MKLIAVEATFSATDRVTAIARFCEQADAVRAMDGCVRYAIYSSVDDKGGIEIVQHWTSMELFDMYRKSDIFAALGMALKPMMTVLPATTVADVAG